jgi:hypothetical protein
MKASIVATLFVGFAAISFCECFTSLVPHANPAALSRRALHSTQLFVSVQETQETSVVSSSPSDNDKKVRLLKQAENYLGSSSMVYLYSELRQLSYCGYTRTKFKDVDCNQEGQPMSTYKLLDILLREREWVIQRTLKPKDGESWRSDRR